MASIADALHRDLLGRGFETFRYRPFERVLEPLHGADGRGQYALCAGCGAVGGAGAVGAAVSVGDGEYDLGLESLRSRSTISVAQRVFLPYS